MTTLARDELELHTIDGVIVSGVRIPACGDHPELIGYMVGRDDGVTLLSVSPEEAVAKCETLGRPDRVGQKGPK